MGISSRRELLPDRIRLRWVCGIFFHFARLFGHYPHTINLRSFTLFDALKRTNNAFYYTFVPIEVKPSSYQDGYPTLSFLNLPQA